MGSATSHQHTRFVEGEVHEHRNRRHRSGQERLRRAWRGRIGQTGAGAPQRGARQAARTHRQPAAMPDRHGSLLRHAPLGA